MYHDKKMIIFIKMNQLNEINYALILYTRMKKKTFQEGRKIKKNFRLNFLRREEGNTVLVANQLYVQLISVKKIH